MLDSGPAGWSIKRISEICEINPKGLSAKTDPTYAFNYVAIDDLDEGRISNSTRLTFAEAPSRARRLVRAGDVVVSTVRPYLRAFSKVHDSEDGFVVSTGFCVLRPKAGVTTQDFMTQLVFSEPFVEHLKTRMTGSNYPAVKAEDIEEFELFLPPLREQERIAEILTSVDDSIRATEAVIVQVERMKRGVIEDLLTGGLGSEAITRGEMPEGWSSNELKEICSIRGEYGANAPKSDYDPSLPRYVRITDIDDRGNLQEATAVSIPREKAASYILDEGDIVIARSGATVGKSYIHTADNGECAFAGYLVRFRLKPEIASYDWLKFVLQSKPYWDWVRDNQRAGAQPNINAKEYGSYLLKVPPLAEQKRIARILGSIDEQISQNRRGIAQIQRIKHGLLNDLLTGRVRTVS